MNSKKISKAVIMRLPRYYRYLTELHDKGEERISSNNLSKIMDITASQVRQDLNNFGEFGLQGYGYNVDYLRNEISKVMGIDTLHNMILIGLGNLGTALLKYNGFSSKGFIIKAIFEQNKKIVGQKVEGIDILPISSLEDYLKNNNIDIVVLTVPKESALDIINMLPSDKRIGIWNFSNMDIKVGKNIVIENVHLSESLMRLSYSLKKD